MKKDLFETRQQMNMTSAQDEFSKWARLRRKVDKLTAQVDEQSMCASVSYTHLTLPTSDLV